MLAPWQAMLPKMASDDHQDDDEWYDDEDEDDGPPAPPGVWTPPRYDEDENYGPTGGMYGTHDERYLEDVFHGHLVDLTDQESIDAYEHQRTKPKFKGSGLEDTMWTNIANRYESSGEYDDVNEEGDEDFQHPKIVDYFNKVHGCEQHLFTPPDLHEPHGNFGEHKEGWDPDQEQDPFDPRLIGASRRRFGGMNEIKVNPGPHRLSIERHLVDEDYRDDWMGSDESYMGDPEMTHEMHSSGAQALKRMQEVAGDWGCTVSEYPGEDRADAGEPGTRYFQFDGPEEDEIQGYAELRPRPVPTQDYRPDDDVYPQMNRSLLSNRMAAMNELHWKQDGERWNDDREPESVHTAVSGDHDYHIMAPWRHDSVFLNGFMETLDSEQPHMWALLHRFDPDNGYWDHAVTYHPTMEHAIGAAEHHHVTGEAPSKWPGTIPHSDYDPDHVEAWPDIAENVDREREEAEDNTNESEADWEPPEIPDYANRKNGLKWKYNNYWADEAPRYVADLPEGTEKSTRYEVQGPHAAGNGLGHPEGSYSVRWYAPGHGDDPTLPRGHLTGEYQANLSGRGYHQNLEDAMRWAENHATNLNNWNLADHYTNWNPDDRVDPNDPRIKGASKEDGE